MSFGGASDEGIVLLNVERARAALEDAPEDAALTAARVVNMRREEIIVLPASSKVAANYFSRTFARSGKYNAPRKSMDTRFISGVE